MLSLKGLVQTFRSTSTPVRTLRFAPQTRSLSQKAEAEENAVNTHYKITLRRSAISLGERIQGTLHSLGIYRRMQTVYYRHCPQVAGKILKIKELVEVENVPVSAVRSKVEQTKDRKASRGFLVKGNRLKGLEL